MGSITNMVLNASLVSKGQKSCVSHVVCASKIGCVTKPQKNNQDQFLKFL